MAYTTIDKPTDYFETVNYTASTSSSYSETSLQFQPDFIWLKNKDTTYPHHLFDAVRGSSLGLSTNSTDPEQTRGSNYLTSFDSNGFTTGNAIASDSADGVVAWSWLASNTTASNTDGSVTSTVSVNTTAGFSICKFTNPSSAINFTFGHGLGVAPRMFIMKGLNTSNWQVYHESMGNTNMIQLNYSSTKSSAANWWNSTSPSSTVCTVGSDFVETSQDSIAYVFAEKQGYSKFGSYTGNGNADGPFVYLGFRPAWVMVKTITDNGYNWVIYDNKRVGFNPDNDTLTANETRVEQTTGFGHIDMVSNGFKVRASTNDTNRSGNTFIYMAFAENPFVSSGGIPTTAR